MLWKESIVTKYMSWHIIEMEIIYKRLICLIDLAVETNGRVPNVKPGVDLMEIKRTWVSVSLLWKRIEYDKMP